MWLWRRDWVFDGSNRVCAWKEWIQTNYSSTRNHTTKNEFSLRVGGLSFVLSYLCTNDFVLSENTLGPSVHLSVRFLYNTTPRTPHQPPRSSFHELELQLEAKGVRDGRRERGEEHGPGEVVEERAHAEAGDAVGAVELLEQLWSVVGWTWVSWDVLSFGIVLP